MYDVSTGCEDLQCGVAADQNASTSDRRCWRLNVGDYTTNPAFIPPPTNAMVSSRWSLAMWKGKGTLKVGVSASLGTGTMISTPLATDDFLNCDRICEQ